MSDEVPRVNTAFLLIALYNGLPVIPLDRVCKDFFGLSAEKFLKKVDHGDIKLPIVRMDPTSQKTAKGVHVSDLAEYIDKRTEAARKECAQLNQTAA
jgi:Pyocin activator protein PrtN